ncbi:Tat pathway signal protein [Streptomyces sp. NPDC002920]
MTDADTCPPARRRRAAALLAAVPLLASLLSLTAAGTARADDPVDPTCAPLALAPFGDPGDAVGRATVAPDSSVCYTVTVDTPGLYLAPALDGSGNAVTRQLLAADGSQVDCYGDAYTTRTMCAVPAAGTYTLKVLNTGWEDEDTSVSFVPLGATRGCADPVGTNWDQPDLTRTTVSPVEVDCQPFEGASGDRVRLTYGSKTYGDSLAWITDATGARICEQFPENDEDSCVLPGDGPYRVISTVTSADNGFPAEYAVKVRRLNDPQGCTTAPVRPYGPLEQQDLTTNPCFTFTAAAAGPYTVHSVNEDRQVGVARVYDAAGLSVCRYGADPCRIKDPGTYTAVLDDGSYPFRDTRAGLVVLDRASDAGCVATGTGLYRGELSTVGQYDCLALDAPQGARIAALTPAGSSGAEAEVEVVDRDGTVQCSADKLSGGDCALTGTAPYRALVHTDEGEDDATGPYGVALYRTDAANNCPVLPAGGFSADGAKAGFATGGGVFSGCLNIPADAHTASEVLQLDAASGDVGAEFSVLDSDGRRICAQDWPATHSWALCALTPGKAHTVLVTGLDQTATYTMTRRDVTATASSAGCTEAPATAVGGPSAKGAYTGKGAFGCRQVTTTAATDVLHINVRDSVNALEAVVLDAAGNTKCTARTSPCAVTGSTTYQVLVRDPMTTRTVPVYRLDALRVATAAGPAPECTKVPSVAYGYGPVTGTLDETRTAVCAVLPTARTDRFDAEITNTAGSGATAVPVLYNSRWTNGCSLYTGGYECEVASPSGSAQSVFLLGLPDKVSSTSYSARLTCASALCGPDKVSVTALSPATGVTGAKVRLTVTGTALPANATVRLTRSGTTLTATTDSVSADNRTLTATLDLTGAATGTWNVSVLAGCCEYRPGSFTVAEPLLANTAAPKVTGTAKTGAKVTATPGGWSATPTSYTYQWKADGRAIGGATAKTYTVPASLVGKKLTVTVTAVRSGWRSASATSAAVTVAKGDAPRATKAPVVSGTAKVGKTLKTTRGTWSPAATSYAYQWYANGRAISGATKSSLVLKSAQKGKKITVKVIAHRTGHKDGSAVSKATRAVAR